ncbi:hypothetical protein [Streptomyces sp. Ru71]|uniref:hypothetical protein n=1 Tax=Streptomyces sp. Ru71 TaxID=2080746 RepID=UPI000CDE373C|nr:hypothetical protein [Streptomyces sp. Ru71]
MATQQSSTAALRKPLRTAASAMRRVPGASLVGRTAGGALDRIGAMSPRGRRLAVYTGAGVLGVAGVVEWPVAVTGAAVAWLTQPRPGEPDQGAGTASGRADEVAGSVHRGSYGSAHHGPVGSARPGAAGVRGAKGTARPGTAGSAQRGTEAAPAGDSRHETAMARSAAKQVAKTATLSAARGPSVHHVGTRMRKSTASPTRTRLGAFAPDARPSHGEE